jgi:phenylglyoxylate dehydrogenase beta subunit
MLYVCIDNEGYMNTGSQRSGTTPFGSWTSTTPVGAALRGKTRDQKYMPLIMMMHKCEYVATASVAFLHDFYEKLDKALEASERGMAYLHVFSPCVSGWRYETAKTMAVQRMAVAANMFPLWECENQTGRIRFTVPVDQPVPVERYLSMLGKYRHLNDAEIAHVQRTADERIALLGALARVGETDHQ